MQIDKIYGLFTGQNLPINGMINFEIYPEKKNNQGLSPRNSHLI